MAVRQRLTWIDWCKSIAIYLVILGHLPLQEQPNHFIYLWHMPLFFMISGYLFKRSPLKDEVRKCAYSLLLPYLIYNVFYMLPLPHGGEFKQQYIVHVLIGNQEELCFLMRPLWFLVSLMVMRIICSSIKLKTYLFFLISLFISITLFGMGLLHQKDFDPFQIQTTVFSLPFFLMGLLLKENDCLNRLNSSIFVTAVVSCVLFILFTLVGLYNYGSGINAFRCDFGKNIFLFYLVSFALSIILFIICHTFSSKDYHFIRTISNGTLFILCTHLIIIWKINSILENSILISIIVLLISYPLIMLCERYCPILIGKRF